LESPLEILEARLAEALCSRLWVTLRWGAGLDKPRGPFQPRPCCGAGWPHNHWPSWGSVRSPGCLGP